jgi:hypothetical protein
LRISQGNPQANVNVESCFLRSGIRLQQQLLVHQAGHIRQQPCYL